MAKAKRHGGQPTVSDFFKVVSGDFHAVGDLDAGRVPLISCGDTDNGLIGFFEIPWAKTYERALTVAYNGSWPLLSKYHPYRFAAKDDVAVLVPRSPLNEPTLLYVAALLNRMTWRYSYGRKCFRQKLERVRLAVPTIGAADALRIDEAAIAPLSPATFRARVPPKSGPGVTLVPTLRWRAFDITNVLTLRRGDFHSIAALAPGEHLTVSRVATNNGVVGSFERPDDAMVYRRGHITVSTVGGDAFVQLTEFIATDNVIVCAPKFPLRLTTLFFIAFAINYQKWRYGYGRQCYQAKLEAVTLYLPALADNRIDEDAIERIVSNASYWPHVRCHFPDGPPVPVGASARRKKPEPIQPALAL
jgi:hypothetical protein